MLGVRFGACRGAGIGGRAGSVPPARAYNTGMKKLARHTAMVLFTIFGIPLLIAAPFLLYGFLGKP